MYELLVLSLLMRWPIYAYLIATIANDILGPWEKISRGTLSALLTRLEKAKLVAPGDPEQVPFPSTRPSRVFVITPVGRERFYQLMMDTSSNQGTYQRIFRIKALGLEFLSPEDQLYLVDHYIQYCQTGARYQRAEAQKMSTRPEERDSVSPFFLKTALSLMGLVAQEWQLELEWAQHLREQVLLLGYPSGKQQTEQKPSSSR
ncbi:PadR family transcriptional regulator [Ktedonosporobacter rubrisoli]|nr:PadR family transcriptional regulator [Ktedonosporobacter rubrisoli]